MDQVITVRDALLGEDILICNATHWTYTEGEGISSTFTAVGCTRHYINTNYSNRKTYRVTFRPTTSNWDVKEDKNMPLYECENSKVLFWDWEVDQGFSVLVAACLPEEALRQGRSKIEAFIKEHGARLKAAKAKPKSPIGRDVVIHKVK